MFLSNIQGVLQYIRSSYVISWGISLYLHQLSSHIYDRLNLKSAKWGHFFETLLKKFHGVSLGVICPIYFSYNYIPFRNSNQSFVPNLFFIDFLTSLLVYRLIILIYIPSKPKLRHTLFLVPRLLAGPTVAYFSSLG